MHALAAKIRRQASELQAMFKAFGAVESIFFRGVGPGGYDIYGVKFANGVAELRILLAADDKADDVIFRPDGNEQARWHPRLFGGGGPREPQPRPRRSRC